MPRPRRMYKDKETGKYYYTINGKRKYVKVPEGVSSKRLAKINIQNIINLPSARRRKKGGLRQPKFAQKIAPNLERTDQGGLPLYLFKSQRKIATLDEIAKNSDDTSIDKLTKLLLKGLTPAPSSSKIPGTITMMTQTAPITAEAGSQTRGTVKITRKLGQPFRPTGAESKEDERKGESKEAEPRSKATLVKSNAVVKIMEQMARNNESLDYDNVRAYIKKYHQGEVGFQKNIGRAKYDDALEAYNILNPVQQTSVTTPDVMPPPPPRPTRRITTLSDILPPTTASETEDYTTNRRGQRVGGVTQTETEVEGGGYDGEGLFNDEIEKIAKKRIKDYVPVIASDQLNELPKYVARGDKRFGFVVNTNPSTSDGSGNDSYPPGHWTAVFINNEDDYPSIEFFDPLAQGKMPEDLIKMCRRIAVKMNPEVMFKYKQNMLRRQSKMTSNCGFHAVKYLDDRYNGVPFSEATGYDDYMESLNNTPDGSRDGEKEIASYIKKYESYI